VYNEVTGTRGGCVYALALINVQWSWQATKKQSSCTGCIYYMQW